MQIAEQLKKFERAGADLVLLQFSPQLEEMERFAEEVIPLVNGKKATAPRQPSRKAPARRLGVAG